MSGIKEVMPKAGLLFQEQTLNPVLCKPKLLPLKSVTLERLERMQKDAQEKMWEMEKELVKASEAAEANVDKDDQGPVADPSRTDVWRAEDDQQQQEDGET